MSKAIDRVPAEPQGDAQFDVYGHGFPEAFIKGWEQRERQFKEQLQAAEQRATRAALEAARLEARHEYMVAMNDPDRIKEAEIAERIEYAIIALSTPAQTPSEEERS